ncbi:MAG: topoisomerase C-terminal repeat-containing protein, partial [Pseudomonadota bacterium]
DGSDPRLCPKCSLGRLSMRTARSGGAFVGCSNYPECRYTRPLGGSDEDAELSGDGKLLGYDDAGLPVRLRSGRFGPYVQLGDQIAESDEKPKRSSLPKGTAPEDVTLEMALSLLSLPREVGAHPEDGALIEAGIGRYGPYVRHNKTYASLETGDDVLTVGMNRAMELIARKAARGGRGQAVKPLRELGAHPDGGAVNVMEGRYGPYVKWEKVNATIPKEIDPNTITLDAALELVAAKASTKKGGKKKAAPKKAPAKKATAKKA